MRLKWPVSKKLLLVVVVLLLLLRLTWSLESNALALPIIAASSPVLVM